MVFWCGGGLFSALGKGWQNWQKTIFNIGKRLLFLIFNRVSKGTLDSFWCDIVACPSFTAMVFWCGGGLFSAPEAVQREKVGKIGKRLFLIGLQKDFFGAISWRVRRSLPWCFFGVAEGCFQHRRQYNGKRLAKLAKDYFYFIGKRLFLFYWQKTIFYFIGKKTIFHSQAWFEPCCFWWAGKIHRSIPKCATW